MKRVLAAMLAILMLTLCGCSTVVLGSGTLEYEANDIDHVQIINGLTGKTFSVSDREIISTIVNHINSFGLSDGQEAGAGYHYSVTLVHHLNGGAKAYFSVVDADTVIHDGKMYTVKAKDFEQYLEALECDTLTDNELIDSLLEGDTLERLNVIDGEGKISLDKIVSLPKSCPALFELLSRPSGIVSVGSYGVDKIAAFLNSNNPELVEKAQEWIEVLKQLIPEAQEKLENIMETYKNSENNP